MRQLLQTDQKEDMNSVKIIFEKSEYNYITSVSEEATKEDCYKYFVYKQFNVGSYPKGNLQTCVAIEFNPESEIL